MDVGTLVRITTRQSLFYGRVGVLVAVGDPERPNPACLVRLTPDDGGPTLPCLLDELAPYRVNEGG